MFCASMHMDTDQCLVWLVLGKRAGHDIHFVNNVREFIGWSELTVKASGLEGVLAGKR